MARNNRVTGEHETIIIHLHNTLVSENPNDEIWANSRLRKEKRTVPGMRIIPDAINFTKKIAYEVHWAGQRKENVFKQLPVGWSGVNVFITDIWQSEDCYVFSLSKKYKHITADDWVDVPQ